MTAVIEAIALMAVALSGLMVIAWILQQRTGNSGWVDTIWTASFGLVGSIAALWPAAPSGGSVERSVIVAALTLAWSVRLTLHIVQRTLKTADDPRYAELKRQWGGAAPYKMFWFLQSQAFFALPLTIAIYVAGKSPSATLDWQDYLGISLLGTAIIGEAIADRQMANFRNQNSGKARICNVGLWAWSRHPNYFFQWLGWCAYPVIAIETSVFYPMGWTAILAPVIMYWLLVYVSGIPPLEQYMERSRGAAFAKYKAATSQFFLWPPTRTPASQ